MLYTNGTEVASIKFNAGGTNNLDWFSQNNLVQSPWTDLKTATNLNNFGINGAAIERNFEISANYGGCPRDAGWLVITGRHCQWEKRQPIPAILYSKKTLKITWNVQGGNFFNKCLNTFFLYCLFVLSKTREVQN